MIQIQIVPDEVGVRIRFLVEAEDQDPVTGKFLIIRHLGIWNNEGRMLNLANQLVMDAMERIVEEAIGDRPD